MRMAGPDILLFVVGAVLLLGASFFIYEQGGPSALAGAGGGAGGGVFDVTYATSDVSQGAAKQVADYSSAKADFTVNQSDVSKLSFTVSCADTVPGGAPAGSFSLTITIAAPAGVTAPKPSTVACGSTKIDIPIADVPAKTVARGSDASSAAASIPQDANATRAVGTWSVSVSGSRAGGTPLPGLPAGNPSGSIALSATVWKPTLTPVTK